MQKKSLEYEYEKKIKINEINSKKKLEEKFEDYRREIKKIILQKNASEKELSILKDNNINNIKKFGNYLKILDKRINYINNEISISIKLIKMIIL